MTSNRVVSGLMLPLWGEVLWPFVDAWDRGRLTMECPREVRAVRGALLLPVEERADGSQGAGSAWPSIRPHGELLLLLIQTARPSTLSSGMAF